MLTRGQYVQYVFKCFEVVMLKNKLGYAADYILWEIAHLTMSLIQYFFI